jgi:hypothetical protein
MAVKAVPLLGVGELMSAFYDSTSRNIQLFRDRMARFPSVIVFGYEVDFMDQFRLEF